MSNQGTQDNNRNRNNRNRNRGPQSYNKNPNNNQSPRPQSQHQQFVNRKPAKLTFLQKLSIWIGGLFKKPAATNSPTPQGSQNRPAPSERKGHAPAQNREARTNTRDTRKDQPREARPPREPREPRERKPSPNPADITSTRLYLGNLSYETTESDLEDLFKGVGPVRGVEIVYNRHTHKSKGYGFVDMLRIDEAKRAIEVLHDQPFMGRNLVVSSAKPKEETLRDKPEDGESSPQSVDQSATPVVDSAPEVTAHSPANEVVEEVHSFSSEESKKETFV